MQNWNAAATAAKKGKQTPKMTFFKLRILHLGNAKKSIEIDDHACGLAGFLLHYGVAVSCVFVGFFADCQI